MKTTRFIKGTSLLALAFCGSLANAQSFQSEVGLIHFGLEDEFDNTYEMNIIGGRFFTEEVNTSGPLYESGFLSHKSNFLVYLGKIKSEAPGFYTGDGNMVNFSYDHVFQESLVTLGVLYSESDIEYDFSPPFGNSDVDISTLGISVGKYITPDLRAKFNYLKTDFSSSGGADADETSYGFDLKKIIDFQGQQAINLEAAFSSSTYEDDFDKETNRDVSASLDYYFNSKIGVGVGFAKNSGDDTFNEGNTLELRSSLFFTPKVYAELSYGEFSPSDENVSDEHTVLELGLVARF